MGSKLPDDLKWSEAAAELLAETDKTSVKAMCITKNAESKEKKEACMGPGADLMQIISSYVRCCDASLAGDCSVRGKCL